MALKKLTDEMISQIDELHETLTYKQIASKFNVAASTVYCYATPDERVITVKSIQEINKLYDGGATLREVGKEYGISYKTVAKYIWKPRKTGRQSKQPLIKLNGKTKFLKNATEKERFEFYTSSSVGELSKMIDKLIPYEVAK